MYVYIYIYIYITYIIGNNIQSNTTTITVCYLLTNKLGRPVSIHVESSSGPL